MKVTETRLDTLIDNLNTLICEDSLLTRPERETLVLAVAAIGAMKAHVSMKKAKRRQLPNLKRVRGRRLFPIHAFLMPVRPGCQKRKHYYWMRSMASRMMKLVSSCSGFPRNWGERSSASPAKSRHKDI
ncbi:hypothetical protein Q7527_25075 [Klebsiella oxytoca]|nr:hypothetical protein [Klebsiella oxytoca]MDO9686022.1 hypothetical protein [Klebsiella oxytoca]